MATRKMHGELSNLNHTAFQKKRCMQQKAPPEHLNASYQHICHDCCNIADVADAVELQDNGGQGHLFLNIIYTETTIQIATCVTRKFPLADLWPRSPWNATEKTTCNTLAYCTKCSHERGCTKRWLFSVTLGSPGLQNGERRRRASFPPTYQHAIMQESARRSKLFSTVKNIDVELGSTDTR